MFRISIHKSNFYQCEETNCPTIQKLKRDTSRYREETQTKIKYPAETTSNAAKIPRQMPLFIKTISAAQITNNPEISQKQLQHKESNIFL